MKIYTKTGDRGETFLLGGQRVSKDCVTLEVIGEIDELNSIIGESVAHDNTLNFLQFIQRDLFKAGAEIAAGQGPAIKNNFEVINKKQILALERQIDEYWAEMPELKNFIIPGGSAAGAHLHHARAVCRRAERALAAFGKNNSVRPELYIYFNRLSDFLFAAARWVNRKDEAKEILFISTPRR